MNIKDFVTFGLVLITSVYAVGATCNTKKISEREILIEMGEKKILVLGWRHVDPSGSTQDDILSLFNQANAVKTCGEFSKIMENALKIYSSNYAEGARVLKTLDQFNSLYGIDFIGDEQDPEDSRLQAQALKTYDSIFDIRLKFCPLSELVSRVRLILPGPRMVFLQQNPKVQLIGLEDAALKQKASDIMSQEMPSIDFAKLSPEILDLLSNIQNDIVSNTIIQDSKIETVYKLALKDAPDAAEDILFSLKQYQEFIQTSFDRSIAMANNAAALQGNVAIVVGEAHSGQIAEQILKSCLKN